jgi:hypothetical protein
LRQGVDLSGYNDPDGHGSIRGGHAANPAIPGQDDDGGPAGGRLSLADADDSRNGHQVFLVGLDGRGEPEAAT